MENVSIYPLCLRRAPFVHVDFSRTWRKLLFIADQYHKGHYINSTVCKSFFHEIMSLHSNIAYFILIVLQYSISFNCKYPTGNCTFGVGDGDAWVGCGCVRGWQWRHIRVTPLASFWYFYCQFWACLAPCSGVSVVNFEQVNAGWVLVILMRKFILINNIFDWFIYFVAIFCSIRLFFTVNVTNFNNYLIYIMKLICSEVSSGFGLALYCNQPVCLHCGLVGWFLHSADFLMGGFSSRF